MDAPAGGRRLRRRYGVWTCGCARAQSGFRLLERSTAGYIALFQGTPLLMQLFVVYYGLALAGLRL